MNYLIQFSVENFLSFKDKTTFSLFNSVDNSLKKNLLEVKNEKFTLSPVSAIYGANSSGKTNLLKAIGFLKFLLSIDSGRKVNEKIPFLPFKLTKDIPTSFQIIFISEGTRYGYILSFTNERIIVEGLYTYPKGKQKKVFERKYLEDKEKYEFSYGREYSTVLKDIEIKTLSNKLFLSTAAEWCELKEIKEAIIFFTEKVIVNVDYSNPNWLHFTVEQLENNKKLRDMFLLLLQEVNPTIKNIKSKIIRKKVEIEELPSEIPLELKMLMAASEGIQVDVKIEYENDDLILDISEESRGIQRLFEIGGPILEILLKGEILIFDELETSLHPTLAKKIVELFTNKKYNRNGAQLIFSTHDTNLLDLDFLRRDQIWFTEKGRETGYSTKLTCLSQIKGIRKDENIKKGFLQGKYTNIPFLTGNYLDKIYGDNHVKN